MHRRASLACLFILGAACSDKALPGNQLGTYQVVGHPMSNTCGLSAPDPWTFTAELSQQGTTLYWSWLDGSPLVSGTLAQSAASLKTTQMLNADSTDAGLGPCNLERDDDLEVALGAGSPPATFGGSVSYAYSVASGATCTDQLAPAGTFQALPCAVHYTVSATRQ